MVVAGLVASIYAGAGVADDGKLYKWVDEDGNVTYQDQPPPGDNGQVETMNEPVPDAAEAPVQPDVAVVLYAIDVCEACDLVRDLLRERGIPFQEKNAESGPEVQAELKKVAGSLSVPILTIDDQVLRGYNRDLILNELEEAGFSMSVQANEPQPGEQQGASPGSSGSLTREDLEGMTPEQIEQAARDAALRGEDNDLFDEDEGFTINDDALDNNDTIGDDTDPSQWEEIPEDERLDLNK